MEHMLVEEFIREVRITLDENRMETEYLVSNTDNMELDGIIRSKILEAVRAVTLNAPLEILDAEPMIIPEAAQYAGTDGSGYVVLPPDFFRLVLFKMRSWRAPVFVAVSDTSDIAGQQKNMFTRATPLKPVCVLSRDLSGNRTLEYYTVGYMNDGKCTRRDHAIDRALYIRYPEFIEEDSGLYVDFSKLLHEAVVNYCAGLALVSRGNPEAAQNFFNLSKNAWNE